MEKVTYSNKNDEASVRLARGAKLQKNAEKVREVNPDANKDLCKKPASAAKDNNPKKRTK